MTVNNCTSCDWSPWTGFTDCSNACNGTQSRYRTFDGPNCDNKRTEEDKRPCSSNCTIVCYETLLNGTIATYNVGDLIRETRCNRSICHETGTVETKPIPGMRVDGQWNLWSPWSECSQVCNGTRSRRRLCSSPAPECDGEVCAKLPHTRLDAVKISNDTEVLEEIEQERCGQLCFTSTTLPETSTTTFHDECYVSNGTDVVVVSSQTAIANPKNPCEICTCKEGSLTCAMICSESEQTCWEKQGEDPNNIYTWYEPEPGQCCGTCNKTRVESNCRVEILPDEYVKVGQCKSLLRLPRERCAGGCESQASNVLTLSAMSYQLGNSTCECCAPKETYTETVSMECTGPNEVYYDNTAVYTRIRSCECQVCKG